MTLADILDKALCQLNPKTNLPKHMFLVPEEEKINEFLIGYCYDARKDFCSHHLTFRGKSYCTYPKD